MDDGIKYLVLFASEKYNAIYNSIRYLKSAKIGIAGSISQSELIHIILYL